MLAGKNKGETLVETMVGIFVAAITIIFLVTTQSVSYKSRNADNNILEGTYNLEAVAKLILCNLTYEEIKENFNNSIKYINRSTLKSNLIMDSNILSFVEESEGSYPSIEIEVREGEGGTLIINIKYYFENGYFINNIYYKGGYQRVDI